MTAKPKPRAIWWIVSTHFFTTLFGGFAFGLPVGVGITLLFGVLGFTGYLAVFTSVEIGIIIGSLCGTLYSLRYLSRSSVNDNWERCTIPSVVLFAIWAIALPFGYTLNYLASSQKSYPAIMTLDILVGVALVFVFWKLTANGFRRLQHIQTTDSATV